MYNIDRITTQHTPKCVENCSESKLTIIVDLAFIRFSATSIITLKTAFFLNSRLIILLWIGVYQSVKVFCESYTICFIIFLFSNEYSTSNDISYQAQGPLFS